MKVTISTIIALVAAIAGSQVCAALKAPELDEIARVKNHRFGATGEMVKGEEHLRKIIVQWDRVDGATEYEVCHNCDINDSTGELISKGEDGQIIQIEAGRNGECGSRPCMVMHGAPLGYNRFNLRVKVDSEWSDWSVHRNFNVEEPGRVGHEEL